MIAQVHNQVVSNKPLPAGIVLEQVQDPTRLMLFGFVTPIIVQVPKSLIDSPASKPGKSIVTTALLDTGATGTVIADEIADYLGLKPMGITKTNTANGIAHLPNFVVDVRFPNGYLHGFESLKVSSCKLPFCLDDTLKQQLRGDSFGVLIGRDMMAHWNIVWHGPSSSVFIAE